MKAAKRTPKQRHKLEAKQGKTKREVAKTDQIGRLLWNYISQLSEEEVDRHLALFSR